MDHMNYLWASVFQNQKRSVSFPNFFLWFKIKALLRLVWIRITVTK